MKTARYELIADYLREMVASSAPGDRLPSDAELCERFSVSRMTARQPVQMLVTEELVVRRRGVGTFVATHRVPRFLGSPLSFTESMGRRGMRASSRLLGMGPIDPSPDEVKALELDPGKPAFLLWRLRLADDRPMAIERAVMPVALVQSLQAGFEEGSLHRAFEHAGHLPTKAWAEVSARRGTKDELRLLELTPATGILLCETRTIWDQDGHALERTETSYVSQRYSFQALLYRGDEAQ